jgi:hypothetical protein
MCLWVLIVVSSEKIVKRNILVSNHDEHVEDDIRSINNEFNAKSYLSGVEPILGDRIQQLFKGNLLTTFLVPYFFSSTCKSDSCHFQQ